MTIMKMVQDDDGSESGDYDVDMILDDNRLHFEIGGKFDVLDSRSQWFAAEVLDLAGDKVLFHFIGWQSKCKTLSAAVAQPDRRPAGDEWIEAGSHRIRASVSHYSPILSLILLF